MSKVTQGYIRFALRCSLVCTTISCLPLRQFIEHSGRTSGMRAPISSAEFKRKTYGITAVRKSRRKIIETFIEICYRKKLVRKGKTRDDLNTEFTKVQVSCWCTVLFWALPTVVRFQNTLNPLCVWLFATLGRKLGSDSLKGRHLGIRRFAHVQTSDRCVSIVLLGLRLLVVINDHVVKF